MSENDLNINELSLDKEWLKQANLCYNYNKELAIAKHTLDVADAKYDKNRADTARDIRKNPEKYEMAKVTEDAIKEVLGTIPELQNDLNSIIEAKLSVGLIQASVNAIDHKKRALECLVQLHGMGYFATPRTTCTKEVENDIMKHQTAQRMAIKKDK
jgi:hypothetical protein